MGKILQVNQNVGLLKTAMSYPYPTINQDRQYVNMCILPHKVKDIQTYAECEAAMSGCERQAVKRYHRSGDATQAHFAATFNKAAHDDRLVKVKASALPGASRFGESASAPKHGYQYHGACKLLLSHKAKDTLWPAAAAHLEQNLEMYHSGRGPTSRPDMPTLNCHPGPNGRLVCDASNFTQTLNLQ